jgi:hypothetical protein
MIRQMNHMGELPASKKKKAASWSSFHLMTGDNFRTDRSEEGTGTYWPSPRWQGIICGR